MVTSREEKKKKGDINIKCVICLHQTDDTFPHSTCSEKGGTYPKTSKPANLYLLGSTVGSEFCNFYTSLFLCLHVFCITVFNIGGSGKALVVFLPSRVFTLFSVKTPQSEEYKW